MTDIEELKLLLVDAFNCLHVPKGGDAPMPDTTMTGDDYLTCIRCGATHLYTTFGGHTCPPTLDEALATAAQLLPDHWQLMILVESEVVGLRLTDPGGQWLWEAATDDLTPATVLRAVWIANARTVGVEP